MKFKNLHKNLKIRLLDGFFNQLLGNMVFPFMVIYFAQYFGAALTGLLMVGNVVLSMVSTIYGGYISDKYGRKKIMVIAQVSFFISFVGMALANSPWFNSPILTFLMVLLNGLSWGIMGPAAQAMLIDVTTVENRKYVFGLNYWLINIAFAVSGMVGGFLFQDYRFELLFILAVCGFISLLVLIFFIDETYTPSEEKRKGSSKGIFHDLGATYLGIIRNKIFMAYILGITLLGSIEIQGRNYTSVRLADEFGQQSFMGFNWDGLKVFGVLMSENAVFVVLLGLFVAKILSKFRDKSTLAFGILVTGIGFAVMAFTNSPWLLLCSMAIATIGEVVWVPVSQSMSAELADEDNRSSYMAVMGLSYNLKMIIGSLAVTLGAYTSSYFMAFVFLLTAVFSLALLSKALNRAQKVKADAANVGV